MHLGQGNAGQSALRATGGARALRPRGAWLDVLSSRVLYRGSHLSAESPYVARNARAFVTAVLADWRLLPLLDDVVLCASELVTNAVLHADRPIDGSVGDRCVSVGVRCWARSALFLEVGDLDTRMPRRAVGPDGAAMSGRGLFIVDALADRLRWARAVNDGKVVHARFDLARPRADERAVPG